MSNISPGFLIGYGSCMIACARPNLFDHQIHMHAGAKGNKFLGFYIIVHVVRMHIRSCIHMFICMYTYMNAYIYIHAYMHTYIICDQVWENRSYPHILYFEKYLFEIFNALSFSCGTIQSRQMCCINSVVI